MSDIRWRELAVDIPHHHEGCFVSDGVRIYPAVASVFTAVEWLYEPGRTPEGFTVVWWMPVPRPPPSGRTCPVCKRVLDG